MKKLILLLFTSFLFLTNSTLAQYTTIYPEIPRIDVHAHAHNIHYIPGLGTKTSNSQRNITTSANGPNILNYLALRDLMIEKYKIDLAMWINLGGETGIDTINEVSKGRMMTCISDYAPQRGLTYEPDDIAVCLKKGYVGYKMWFAPYQRRLQEGEDGIKYLDNIANDPVFTAMEKAGMVMASVHIADPNGPFGNRGKWCADPVEYWRMIIGLERVLQRHPDLVIVAAHGAWLICQDAQIDFLRYMLKTYPNFYVDIAATFQYYHLVDQENLRDFFIEYSDRILYGTDIGRIKESEIPDLASRYTKSFQILETNDTVEGGFFGNTVTTGLNLPKEVLEKIYYKNALKIYPGLTERMKMLSNQN
jgi:uncharacterized protein